jgi:heme-degrading monooxygenase HmoA
MIRDRLWRFFDNSYMLVLNEGTDSMILEVAVLQVKAGLTDDFERSFKKASAIISSMKGYISHELQKCMEEDRKYILLVKWETLQDHTEGFRGSAAYLEWKSLLHHFYDPFPTVEHYEAVDLS